MFINIKELISDLKDDRLNAQTRMYKYYFADNKDETHVNIGMYRAFNLYIQKLELLLQDENENGGKKDASNDGKPM